MKKISEPIVFFGSGPVAAASLELLCKDFTIEAVITKPRPTHHTGSVPVIDLAQKLKLPVFTAKSKSELDSVFSKQHFDSRLGILIDFGIIVSQKVIDFFPLGIVNSHFSLLPALRGADPITFSILQGDRQTGVSLMLLVKEMDEGPLLAQTVFNMPDDVTTPKLTEKLIQLSYEALRRTIPLYVAGEVEPYPQPTDKPATYSRRLEKTDGTLDWSKPAHVLEKEIRAFSGWPKSRTSFGDLEVIIVQAHTVKAFGRPGRRLIQAGLPVICCGKEALAIDALKPAGKKEMSGKAFLAGYKNVFLG